MDQPRESNREIIQAAFDKFKKDAPGSFVDVVIDQTGPLPGEVPSDLSDEVFLTQARALDKIYQNAARWLLEEPNLDYYASRASTDVRGYYFLSLESDLEARLARWNSLDAVLKSKWGPWLVNECLNSLNAAADCQDELARAQATDGAAVLAFHKSYLEAAKKNYEDYFRIQAHRGDLDWNDSHAEALVVPFLEPSSADVMNWLRTNIEDEWRWPNWNLRLRFLTDAPRAPRVVFEPGVTPHVNGLGGNVITMDSNPDLWEYATSWTIRHEFGHVLGFPDCYVEFYDENKQVMVNYQLDITNLMCSRRGKFQQKHYDELKRVYFN